MAFQPYRIPPQKKVKALNDYVTGQGSIYAVAKANGLNNATVCSWANHEGWGKLRESWLQSVLFNLTAVSEVRLAFDQTVKDLKVCADPRGRKELLQGMEIALRCWSLLTGYAKPGTRKVGKEKPRATEEL